MCIKKYLTKRNTLIGVGVLIVLLLAIGIGVYFLLKPAACKIDGKIKTPEEFKYNFGNEFLDDASIKYLEMVKRNYPQENIFYRCLILEATKAQFRNSTAYVRELDDILKISAANFEYMKETTNRTARFELIRLSKDLKSRYNSLASRDIAKNKILAENCKIRELHKSTDNELHKTIKDIHGNWKQLYECIPKMHSEQYPEYAAIEKAFQEILATDPENSQFKIYSLFERIDSFFNNDFKLSQFNTDPITISGAAGAAINNAVQSNLGQARNFAESGFQQGKNLAESGLQQGRNFAVSGFQQGKNLAESGLQQGRNFAESGLQQGRNFADLGLQQVRNTMQSNVNQAQNQVKNAAEAGLQQFKNIVETNVNQAQNQAKNVLESKWNQAQNTLGSTLNQAGNIVSTKFGEASNTLSNNWKQ